MLDAENNCIGEGLAGMGPGLMWQDQLWLGHDRQPCMCGIGPELPALGSMFWSKSSSSQVHTLVPNKYRSADVTVTPDRRASKHLRGSAEQL